jgi:hypothetical protein
MAAVAFDANMQQSNMSHGFFAMRGFINNKKTTIIAPLQLL